MVSPKQIEMLDDDYTRDRSRSIYKSVVAGGGD